MWAAEGSEGRPSAGRLPPGTVKSLEISRTPVYIPRLEAQQPLVVGEEQAGFCPLDYIKQ